MMNLDATHPEPKNLCRPSPSGPQSRGPKQSTIDRNLHSQIEALIPRLRRYARAMVHDPVAADDLVQDCLVRALGKIHLWEKGTDLRAWLFTILHNQHISLAREAARRVAFGNAARGAGGHAIRRSRIGRYPAGRDGPLASFPRPRNLAHDD